MLIALKNIGGNEILVNPTQVGYMCIAKGGYDDLPIKLPTACIQGKRLFLQIESYNTLIKFVERLRID